MHPKIQEIAGEYKTKLQEIYGDQLSELILFGSYARGEQHEESDLDFAVVLKRKDIRTIQEIKKISGISSTISLKYGIMLSSFPTTLLRVKASQQGIFREIRKDGIII